MGVNVNVLTPSPNTVHTKTTVLTPQLPVSTLATNPKKCFNVTSAALGRTLPRAHSRPSISKRYSKPQAQASNPEGMDALHPQPKGTYTG